MKVPFYVDKDLNILDYQGDFLDNSYDYKYLRQAGISSLNDFTGSNLKIVRDSLERYKSIVELNNNVDIVEKWNSHYNSHLYCDNDVYGGSMSFRDMGNHSDSKVKMMFYYDKSKGEVQRGSREMVQLLKRIGIKRVSDIIDNKEQFFSALSDLIRDLDEKAQKEKGGKLSNLNELISGVEEFEKQFNEKSEIFSVSWERRKEKYKWDQQSLIFLTLSNRNKGPMFAVSVQLEMKDGELCIRWDKVYSREPYLAIDKYVYLSKEMGDMFVATFSSKIKTLDDLLEGEREMTEWFDSIEEKYIDEKSKVMKERENNKMRMMKIKDYLVEEAKIKDLFFYYDVEENCRGYELEIKFSSDHVRDMNASVEFKGDEAIASLDYGWEGNVDDLIDEAEKLIMLKKSEVFIRLFYKKDYYSLNSILDDDALDNEIPEALKHGWSAYYDFLLDCLDGKRMITVEKWSDFLPLMEKDTEADLRYKDDLKLFDFFWKKEKLIELDEGQIKRLLDSFDRIFEKYKSSDISEEERLQLKTNLQNIIERTSRLVKRSVWRDEEELNEEVVLQLSDFLTEKMSDLEKDLNRSIFSSLIRVIKSMEDLKTKKKLVQKVFDKLNGIEIEQIDKDYYYSLMSDPDVLIYAPTEEIQTIVIEHTTTMARSSTDLESLMISFSNLTKLAHKSHYPGIERQVSNMFFDFFQKADEFEINRSSSLSVESKRELENQVAYNLVIFVSLLEDDEMVEKFLDFIKKDKRVGGFMVDNLISRRNSIKNEKLKDFVNEKKENYLPKAPDYEEMLKSEPGYPNGRIVVQGYFLSNDFFEQWQNQWMGRLTVGRVNNKGFMVTETSDGYLFEKKINDVPLQIRLDRTGQTSKKFKQDNDVFARINDDEIDMLFYFGHAGGGNELAQSIDKAPRNERNMDINKLIYFASCSSASFYGPEVRYLFPNSHFFGNETTTRGNDDAYIIETLLHGFAHRKTYEEMANNWEEKYEKLNYKNNSEDTKFGNMVWPHEDRTLDYRDSDGDGLSDSRDYNYSIDIMEQEVYEVVRFDISAASVLPSRNIRGVKNFVQSRMLGPLSSFSDVRFIARDSNVAWFNSYDDEFAERLGRGDIGNEVLKISPLLSEENNHGEVINYFEVEISAAYKFSSDRVLKCLMAKELVEHILKNYENVDGNPKQRDESLEELDKPQSRRVLVKMIEPLMYEFHSASTERKEEIREVLEGAFISLKDHYGLPADFDFETAYAWCWSKKWSGNAESWRDDPYLRALMDKYDDYLVKVRRGLSKRDVGYERYQELVRDGKSSEYIAEELACMDVYKKMDEIFED